MSQGANRDSRATGRLSGAAPELALRDARLAVIALLVAATTFAPAFSYRQGAPLILVAALPDLVRYRPRSPELLAVLFAGLMYASLNWTVSPTLTSAAVANQVSVTVIFISVRACLSDRRAFIAVAFGYLGGCVYALVSLLRQNSGASLSLRFDAASTERYGLTGLNPNYTAYALAAGVGIAVLVSTSRRTAWFTAASAVAAAYAGIVLTGSRGAAVAALMTLGWWLLPHRLRRRGLYVLYSMVAVSSVAIFTGAGDAFLRSQTPAEAGRETGDLNGRLQIWPLARDAIDEHLWLGQGAGSFPSLNTFGVYAHNVFLDIAAGLGILGLVVYILLMWTTLIGSHRAAQPKSRVLIIGTSLACLAAPLLAGYWYQAPATWAVLALLSSASVLDHGPRAITNHALANSDTPVAARASRTGAVRH